MGRVNEFLSCSNNLIASILLGTCVLSVYVYVYAFLIRVMGETLHNIKGKHCTGNVLLCNISLINIQAAMSPSG